ncbi:MAG: chemotaxis protein MotB [Candidatus Magnetoglobus multicellularis str. Araruama]|uniref:Chemotaxis protein MotB n=1 Tax=Candidatus Magnetoglobus multicellularis str. Araruama TaxID=890399 RepID=A0A1V1PDS3_9BACT|nr:MAG: chemotaxis protein MotB [Candidatus Magnetoglobus multicellularis str. Araruama]
MAKKKDQNPDDGTDPTGWMVTFGDLLMLLLTFFVMLLTMRSLDTAAIKAIFQPVGKGGGIGALLFPESKIASGILESTGSQDAMLIVSYAMLQNLMNEGESADVDDKWGSTEDNYDVYENQEGYVIGLKGDVLFESGQADIKPAMHHTLDRIAFILNAVSNDILIVGHTDKITPGRSRFPSNWELSLYRALSVHDYFINVKKLDPIRFSTGGAGSVKPLTSGENFDERKKTGV